jgi:hypothetical protein
MPKGSPPSVRSTSPKIGSMREARRAVATAKVRMAANATIIQPL